ncbi:response regulator [Acuticoccus sp. MNP-M23]|uniref:response regulator n=1 Tax=Acuticoccus sp. MNP-M23 TaxID=3072793 RepID=UPI0028162278|nr:response regulator [Acuticoccus sp. MNP-M23]WMS43744.1 response regulator [Acuticoccus sp. MNP-M23]
MRDGGAGIPPRVLVVEDNTLIAMELTLILEEAGYLPVGPASDAATALSLIDKSAPHCAVLDINLGPALTSAPIARRLNALAIPFVYLSGYTETYSPDELPAGTILPKPVEPDTLAAALAALTEATSESECP